MLAVQRELQENQLIQHQELDQLLESQQRSIKILYTKKCFSGKAESSSTRFV
jgi:hypothetical protein